MNGEKQALDGPTGLADYLRSLEIDLRNIAVAHNGVVLRRDELSMVTLREGDEVEIVRAVGGG